MRYTDTQLIGYVNEAIKMVRRLRPDLFFGEYLLTLPTLISTSDIGLDAQYDPSVVDYVVARAESRDDDYVNTGRVSLFMQSFGGAMRS